MDYSPQYGEEEEEPQFAEYLGRDGLIFLVDCSKEMFSSERFAECIEIVEATMLNRVIRSERDLLGIVFYNTEHSPAAVNEAELEAGILTPNNVSVFMNIKNISVDSIKYIRRFKENNFYNFPEKYGHCDTNPDCLNDAFWLCAKMFKSCGYKLHASDILLLTNNSKPFDRGSSEERNAFKKAEDLRDSGIRVNLVPMTDQFSGLPFYKQFISIVNDIEEDDAARDLENPDQRRKNLVERVFRKDFRKRCNQHAVFTIGEDLKISVGIYSMYRLAKPPKRVTLLRDTNEIVEMKRVTMISPIDDEESFESRKLLPSEELKYQELGNKEIKFTKQEYKAMRRIKEPGITLLGFKPKQSFVLENHARGPIFLFPDETTVTGSTTLFRALWQSCIKLEKIAYAVLTNRFDAHPKLVMLIPQEEEQIGDSRRADGFRVEFIPYVECVRDLDALFKDENVTPEAEGVENFKKLIKKLKFPYSPHFFNNPSVHTKYDCIEAQVFEKEPPSFVDTTLPDLEAQDAKIDAIVEALNRLFPAVTVEAEKRKTANTQKGERSAKVPKLADSNEIESACQNGTLHNFNVQQLKSYLMEKGLKNVSKLKKDELIQEITNILA